jgi:hypothetical protein
MVDKKLGDAVYAQENEQNNVSDPNNQQSTPQAALEKVKYEDFSTPTTEAEAQDLLWYEKASSQINYNIRLRLGEYFYNVSQQFQNGENTVNASFNDWLDVHKEQSGFPSRSTVFEYIKLYKKKQGIYEGGQYGARPVAVKGLTRESVEFLEQFSTESKKQKRRDAIQKAVDFIRENPDIQAQFEQYITQPTNPTVDMSAGEVNENGGE